MMSIFSNPSPAIKKLISYVKDCPDKEDKWKEKAVKSLVKRLKKSNQIEELEKAIRNQDSGTKCITLQRLGLEFRHQYIYLFQ